MNISYLLIASLGMAAAAQAASVSIVNPGFESDAAAVAAGGGWADAVPSGWADPNGASNGNFMEQIGGFAADGIIHLGFDASSDSGLGLVYQNLSTAWAPNTRYTLTLGVGNRSGWGAGAGRFGFGSSTDLPTGSVLYTPTVFFSDVDTSVTPAPGDGLFSDLTVTFTTGSTAPTGNIQITTQRTGGANRLHVDNYRLDATPVPEASGAVFGLAALGLLTLRRRR